MNNQEIFDTVHAHLIKQSEKSIRAGTNSSCGYRGPRGLKCAIGALVPDDKYDQRMEGKGVGTALRCTPQLEDFFEGYSFSLLNDLQVVHDDAEIADWPHRLKIVAHQFNLTYTPIKA